MSNWGYTHSITWIFLILLTVPVYQIFKNTSGPINKLFQKHLDMKICLYGSLIASYLYVVIISVESLFYVGILSKNIIKLTEMHCQVVDIITLCLYGLSRLLLYLFFMIRAYYTFESSKYKYSSWIIHLLIIWALISSLIVVIPSIYINITSMTYSVTVTGHSQYCLVSSHIKQNRNAHGYINLIWGSGSVMDCIFAIICVYLVIYKLFKMINIHSKKSNLIQSIDDYIAMEDINDDNVADDQLSTFHAKTGNHNSMILMICKMLILLFIVIISSQISINFFWRNRIGTFIFFSLDVTINVYCLWLSFGFARRIYYKYFCGKQCIKCCFPCIKTVALSCCNGCCCNSITINKNIQIYKLAKIEINEMVELE